MILTCAIGLAAGLMIGCIGVGGIIVVPALVQFAGVPVHAAIAAAMAGFIVTGLVGSFVFLRRGTLGLADALAPNLGAMPAALVGALLASRTPSGLLQLAIAGLTILAGYQIVAGQPARALESRPTLSHATRAGVGAGAGFLSALTGTGGPALLLPVLLWLDVPILTALGIAQTIQLPIAALATLGNAASGSLRVGLALPLAVTLAIGSWIGARLAHSVDHAMLRRLVGVILLAVGLLMLGRVAVQLV